MANMQDFQRTKAQLQALLRNKHGLQQKMEALQGQPESPQRQQELEPLQELLSRVNQMLGALFERYLDVAFELTGTGAEAPAPALGGDGAAFGQLPVADAMQAVSSVELLLDIDAMCTRIQRRLDWSPWQTWDRLPLPLALVWLVALGWPACLLSRLGFVPYTDGLRTRLNVFAAAVLGLVLVFGWSWWSAAS